MQNGERQADRQTDIVGEGGERRTGKTRWRDREMERDKERKGGGETDRIQEKKQLSKHFGYKHWKKTAATKYK